MVKKAWLQYHNYERYGYPNEGGISTNRGESLEQIRWEQDVIFLMVGLRPTRSKLLNFGIDPAAIANISDLSRLYFLWEVFVPQEHSYTGQKAYGGFDYEIYGHNYTLYKPPILLLSQEFQNFWDSYKMHGFICISDLGLPFPEIEDTGEGFHYRVRPTRSTASSTDLERVSVNPAVLAGITFLRGRFNSDAEMYDRRRVQQTLIQYGHTATARWVEQNFNDFVRGLRTGFVATS